MVQIKAVSGTLKLLPAVSHAVETVHCEGDDVVITVSAAEPAARENADVAVYEYEGERAVIEGSNAYLRELLADRIAIYMTGGQRGELPFLEIVRQALYKVKRRFVKSGLFRKAYYGTALRESDEATRLLSFLERNRNEFIAVLAPHPDDPTLSQREGYMQRVRAVDAAVLRGFKRIYLYDSEYWKTDEIRVEYRGQDSFYIIYSTGYASHRNFALSVLSQCRMIYIHSALRIMSRDFSSEILLNPFQTGKKVIFDMHGALSEEVAATGTTEQAAFAKKAEQLCVENSSVIVTVTENLADYLRKTYGSETGTVILPIFSTDKPFEGDKPEGRPIVIYAGGTQSWQCIDEMVQAVNACEARLDYRFCLTDISEADRLPFLSGRGVQILSLEPEDLAAEYRRAAYGFLLREDNTLNRVACPTKLIEYLTFGIVPILKSDRIGDFGNSGIRYLPVKDFIAGRIPSDTERREMVAANRILFEQISVTRRAGIEKLVSILAARRP